MRDVCQDDDRVIVIREAIGSLDVVWYMAITLAKMFAQCNT
jgi:hypothetical protein